MDIMQEKPQFTRDITTNSRQCPVLCRYEIFSSNLNATTACTVKTHAAVTNMSKIITVFGATGNQGNSVIQQIISDSRLSKEFLVRGVTRDTSKPASKALEKQGVTLVKVSICITAIYELCFVC